MSRPDCMEEACQRPFHGSRVIEIRERRPSNWRGKRPEGYCWPEKARVAEEQAGPDSVPTGIFTGQEWKVEGLYRERLPEIVKGPGALVRVAKARRDYACVDRSDRGPRHHKDAMIVPPKPGSECLVDAALVGSERASSLEYKNGVHQLPDLSGDGQRLAWFDQVGVAGPNLVRITADDLFICVVDLPPVGFACITIVAIGDT